MATVRERESAVRRAAILSAALSCFVEKGVAGTRISDICERSGASVGSVYHHFESKERLAARLYFSILAEYQRGLSDIVTANMPAEQGIRAGIHYHVVWIAEHREQAMFLLFSPDVRQIRAAADPDDLAANDAFLAGLDRWVRGCAERGEMRALPLPIVTALWTGPLHELARRWLTDDSGGHLQSVIATVSDSIWAGLSA